MTATGRPQTCPLSTTNPVKVRRAEAARQRVAVHNQLPHLARRTGRQASKIQQLAELLNSPEYLEFASKIAKSLEKQNKERAGVGLFTYPVLMAADILIYPYREVTTSGALMTGLSFGKPVIATALPFFEEALRGVSSTHLVRYGDVLGLADVLTKAIADWQDGKRPPKETMRANSWQQIGQQTRDCYDEVLRDCERARSRSTTRSGEL